MLFSYTFVAHDIEKMHAYVEYVFQEVWCRAGTAEYGIELFDGMPDLKNIIEELWKQEELAGKPIKSAQFFLTGINEIFNEFKALEQTDVDKLKNWFSANNNLEECCRNSVGVRPVKYKEIQLSYPLIAGKLKPFFMGLYSTDFLSLKVLKQHLNLLSEHYRKFVIENDEDVCPFCGLYPLDGQYSDSREAYDHYLPKSKYPFNSINFKNLFPCCSSCNSKNKGVKDPLEKNGMRRKAFYPLDSSIPKLTLEITISSSDWQKIIPAEIALTIGPDEWREEIETWKDVYNIDSRYKDFVCRKNAGKAWLSQVQALKIRDRSISEYFEDLSANEVSYPHSDYNFLKKPYLEGCQKAGLFDEV
ncbi:HNH endonuclease signature motif containing protein [Desulforhopalus sp. 52FAK]